MEREPENDERIEEVDWESRKKSGDQQDATGSPGTGPRPSETQGDERQRMGNKNPDPDTGHES